MTRRTVAIVTDSTAYIPKDLQEQYGIFFVPNVVVWGTQTLRDGVDIGATEFFERLRTDPIHPTTAVTSVGDFRDVYARAADSADAVVAIHLSAKLSGTFAAGEQAKALLPDKRITVIDSNSTTMAMGFVVLAAARAAAEGKSYEAVAQIARETIPHVGVFLTMETLKYLQRGGRIGGAQAFIGNVLDMKPILELRDGRIEPVERVRSKKKAVERLIEALAEKVKDKTPLRLSVIHAAAQQEAMTLLETARARLNPVEAIVADVSPTVAVHTGPGTIGIAFCAGR
jgi:DegV family protein with EDD domain